MTAIRTGQCDAAIVAGASICIKPATAVQFNNLTMLSPDGSCKSFDESGEFQEGICLVSDDRKHWLVK